MSQYQYDLIVIGAGPGGYVAAIRAAQRGLKVALLEKRYLGGTCLNLGCVPTKALIHAGKLYHEARHFEDIGLLAQDLSFDFSRIHDYKYKTVETLRGGVESLLKSYGVMVYHAAATIIDVHTVVAHTVVAGVGVGAQNGEQDHTQDHIQDGTRLTATRILIATGSTPSTPPFKGLDAIIGADNIMTSDELLYKEDELLPSLIILGANVVSLEFATWYNALGSEVTIILRKDRIIPTMDKDIAQNLAMILKKRGVKILSGSTIESISAENGVTVYTTNKAGETQAVSAAGLLLATGRKPYTEGLFGAGFSVETQDGAIVVDENFRTSADNIYAIGDVTGAIQLAHFASAMGMAAVEKMLGGSSPIDLSVVPLCLYTDPEIACVGITADEAKAQEIEVKVGKFLMSANGKSLIEREERGFIKVVCDAQTQIILGAQLMCGRATDMVGELAIAIAQKLTIEQVRAVIHPHPTFCEGIYEAVEDAEGLAIHAMRSRRT